MVRIPVARYGGVQLESSCGSSVPGSGPCLQLRGGRVVSRSPMCFVLAAVKPHLRVPWYIFCFMHMYDTSSGPSEHFVSSESAVGRCLRDRHSVFACRCDGVGNFYACDNNILNGSATQQSTSSCVWRKPGAPSNVREALARVRVSQLKNPAVSRRARRCSVHHLQEEALRWCDSRIKLQRSGCGHPCLLAELRLVSRHL